MSLEWEKGEGDRVKRWRGRGAERRGARGNWRRVITSVTAMSES